MVKCDCTFWARNNECDKNPTYMYSYCKKECAEVGKKQEEYAQRCVRTNNTAGLPPNSLHTLFDSIVQNYPELEPELVCNDPPIIVFDKFAYDEETDSLIDYARGKYIRSTGLEVKADGTYASIETSIRTSSNTWCQSLECMNNIFVKNLTDRVSRITNIPSQNFEYAQLLYYHSCNNEKDTNCSFYKKHHDYISGDRNKNQGVRVFTCFVYLNDVEEGGLTVFESGISVRPKKGRAILWPSVKNDDPHEMDIRTNHEAKPVLKGEKMAANFWIHQYDFKTPHSKGCAM